MGLETELSGARDEALLVRRVRRTLGLRRGLRGLRRGDGLLRIKEVFFGSGFYWCFGCFVSMPPLGFRSFEFTRLTLI